MPGDRPAREPNIAGMVDALAPHLTRLEAHRDRTVVEVEVGTRHVLFSREIGDGEHDVAGVLMETLVDAAEYLNTTVELRGQRKIATDHRRPILEIVSAMHRLLEQINAFPMQGRAVLDEAERARLVLEQYGARA